MTRAVWPENGERLLQQEARCGERASWVCREVERVGYFSTPKVKTVSERKVWPGFSSVEGKAGWLGESG